MGLLQLFSSRQIEKILFPNFHKVLIGFIAINAQVLVEDLQIIFVVIDEGVTSLKLATHL